MSVNTRKHRKRRLELDSPDIAFLLEDGVGWLRVEPAEDSGLPWGSKQLLKLEHNSLVLGPASGYPKELRVFLDIEPGARLTPFELSDLYEDDNILGSSGPQLVDCMVNELSVHIHPNFPRSNVEKTLIPGKCLAKKKINLSAVKTPLWCKPETASVRYGEAPYLSNLESDHFYPLTKTLWLDVEADTQLTCASTAELFASKQVFESVQQFMTHTLFAVYEHFSDLYIKDFVRLEQGVRHKKELMEQALAGVASVLSPVQTEEGSSDHLFCAFSTVCKELGYPTEPLLSPPRKMWSLYFKGNAKDGLITALFGLLAGICALGIPLAMAAIVGQVIPDGELGVLAQIITALTTITLGAALFELIKGLALLRVQNKVQARIQSAIFSHLLQLPIDFFREFSAGDLASRIAAFDGIRSQFSGAVMTILISSMFGLSNLALMFIYSWQLALGVTVLLTFIFTFLWGIARSQMKSLLKMQNVMGKQAGLELQMVTGITKLRTAGAEVNIFSRWMGYFTEVRKISLGIGTGTGLVTVLTSLLPLIAGITAFSLVSFLGLMENLSLGGFLCFNVAMGQLAAAVTAMWLTALTLVFIYPSYLRAKPILDAKPEAAGPLTDPGKLIGGLQVNEVSYAYPKSASMALKDVSIQVKAGEFVAVVGESGSGKSTLLKMMLGFHQPLSGSVLYDGKDLSRLNIAKVRQQLGVVIQNDELVQGDIFSNIAGSDEDATEEKVWKAAKLADVEADIRDMPMQLKTFVPHGGTTFSGGQQQRILLARALYRNPKILLLDEATSNLDNVSQFEVMENVKQMQTTRFVIAQRLNTVETADRIYVMDKGEIVESGTFQELVKAKGRFAKMAGRQCL